jgi:hypothetical protein
MGQGHGRKREQRIATSSRLVVTGVRGHVNRDDPTILLAEETEILYVVEGRSDSPENGRIAASVGQWESVAAAIGSHNSITTTKGHAWQLILQLFAFVKRGV